jgi:hypothetical protein
MQRLYIENTIWQEGSSFNSFKLSVLPTCEGSFDLLLKDF